MSRIENLGDIGKSVEEGDAIATAGFTIWMLFMLAWLVDPPISPLPGVFGATTGNYNVVSAFFPLLVVIIPVAMFGILKNMFQGGETIRREAFTLTPKILIQVQGAAGSFSERARTKRAYKKKYGRRASYRQIKAEQEELESE